MQGQLKIQFYCCFKENSKDDRFITNCAELDITI